MTKLMFLVLGLLVLSGTIMMVGAAPGARGTSEQATMDIRAVERAVDMKALPNGDLDPDVYR
jgi:hypothetical protein